MTPGRPKKIDNDERLAAIARIAISGSAADNRRRSDVIRTVKTLDELTAALRAEGFDYSRSAVYTHLIPRNVRSVEGKRHVTTAPVKLLRSQNSQHKSHDAAMFARCTIRHLEEIAGFLGPDQITFHSQDDKAKVPIGLTAANKQAPLIMHVEYKVTLPDHDFVIAPQHKLVASVIGNMKINPKTFSPDAVTYSGATYIAVRSAKHLGSSAFNHLVDMKRVRNLPAFENSFKNAKGEDKSVMIITQVIHIVFSKVTPSIMNIISSN